MKIAHRGASGYELENSFTSLRKAIELGADIVEADVQMTKDDVPIICHDKLLDRTSNTSGYTTDLTWEEISQSVRLNNGEKLPSLEEFCQYIRDKNTILYLDVKPFGDEGRILEICKRHLKTDQFLFGSFHNHSIRHVKQLDGNIQTVMIIEGNPIDIKMVIKNSGCDIVGMGFDTIEEDSIVLAQELGKKVFTWTVNDKREIERAKLLGVDGITSNYIDRI